MRLLKVAFTTGGGHLAGAGYQVTVQCRGHHRRHRCGRPCRGGVAAGAGRPGRADQGAGLAPGGRPALPSGRGRAAGPGGGAGRWRRLPFRPGGALGDQPELFGPVASTPTAWRVIERVATDPDGLARLRAARAHARARVWAAGGEPAVALLVIDADATLVLSIATPSRARRGPTRDRLGSTRCWPTWTAVTLPGSRWRACWGRATPPAGGADDLIELVDLALAQLPRSARDRPVLVRSDSAGASTQLAWHLRDDRVGFSLGWRSTPMSARRSWPTRARLDPAIDPDGQPRDGAEVGELTGWVDLHTWPEGTRVLCRREDAHPGAQLRFSDHDGHRFQVSSPTSPTMTWPGWSYATANAPGSRTASAVPRPPAWPTFPSTAGAATLSGWSSCWPLRTSPAGPRVAAGRRAGRGRAQDVALPAVACGRPDRPPRPPGHPAPATLLALGHRARQGVRPAADPAAALLSRQQRRRLVHPPGARRHAHQPPPGPAASPATPAPPRPANQPSPDAAHPTRPPPPQPPPTPS
jgi:hypothetical protein